MIERKRYIAAIEPFIQKPIIKVISGIRRCGKSTLLQQIMQLLINTRGVDKEHIVSINKELFEFDAITNYKDLHQYVSDICTKSDTMYYLFIDEVQEIEAWEKAITSFLAEKKYDIYITGSNAHLLSSELATLLSGRYIECVMHTLTFSEYKTIEAVQQQQHMSVFESYLLYGGFPGIHHVALEQSVVRQYLQAIYNTVLLKDVVLKNTIRDTAMLDIIAKYVIDNCGNITTAKSISQYMKSQKRSVSVDTVLHYLHICCNAHIFDKVQRYDIKGKRILETHEKYYMGDVGFKFATVGYKPQDISGQLENLVYLELRVRGYTVYIGKVDDKEIDFIAEKNSQKLYIQVCTALTDEKVVEREYASLEAIKDHFPKLVLSLDTGFETSRNGINWMNIQDFLLEK
ncbi:MAG: ATP-binding protein [Bacteroidota bacterium]